MRTPGSYWKIDWTAGIFSEISNITVSSNPNKRRNHRQTIKAH